MDNGNSNPNARSLIRSGRVSVVYPERNTVRVVFDDRDDLVSAELQLITPFAGGNKFYSMPDVDEVVVCVFATNDDSEGTGYVLGSVFNDVDKPNSNNHDEFRIDFADGTAVSYNRKSHKLDISAQGDVSIDTKGNISISAQGNVSIHGKRIDLN